MNHQKRKFHLILVALAGLLPRSAPAAPWDPPESTKVIIKWDGD